MNDTQNYISNANRAPPTRPTILSTCEEICNRLTTLEKEVEALSQTLNPILAPTGSLKGSGMAPNHQLQAAPASELGTKLLSIEERIMNLSSRVTDIGQRVGL
jgi:hypothetical protein